MSLKRKIALTGGLVILLGLLLICLLAGAYFYLPSYLETRIIPQLAADAGISEFNVKVRSIGLYSADLADLRIGSPKNPAIAVHSAQIDYSPQGLFRRTIDLITLNGIDLHGEIADGQFRLRGLDIEKLAAAQPPAASSGNPPGSPPPLILARLQIRNSNIIIRSDNRSEKIPFEVDVVAQDSSYNLLDADAAFYPRGQRISAAVKVNRSQSRATVNIDSSALDLNRFADLGRGLSNFAVSGEMALQGKADVSWKPLRISSLAASLSLQHAKIRVADTLLQNAGDAEGAAIPFRIDLASETGRQWRITAGRLAMAAPVPLNLAGIEGGIKISDAGAFESSGNFTAELNLSGSNGKNYLPVTLQAPLPLRGRFSAIYHRSGKWQCEMTNQPSEGAVPGVLHLRAPPYTIKAALPEFNLSATAESDKIEAAYQLTVPTVRVVSESESISIPKLLLKGTAELENKPRDTAGAAFELRAANTEVKFKEGAFKLPDFVITGQLNRDDVRQITLGGVLQFNGAGGRFSRLGARFGGARGKIPFKWPVKGKITRGSIAVADLRFKGLELGRLDSQIFQTAVGMAFEGRHQSTLLPWMKLNFRGESRLLTEAPATASVDFKVSRPATAPEIDLAKFYPAAQGTRIKGKFQMNGNLNLNKQGLGGQIQTDFKNGSLMLNENKLAIEGLRMSISMPEFPKVHSAPGQQIHFNKISLGDFKARNGRIDFQIESARSVLIEKMRFLWCDGNVESQAMRLSTTAKEYHLTFYCDRLNLAQVLDQFGAAAAEGRGSVNGRIPLKYANGKIKFDDGFLFSTPGEGGKIHLTGTDILTAGIAPGTTQYVQMELAREALKDYDYSWAKLNITSEGEELMLKMQMDGKPARSLPFVYKKEIGGFMKVEAEAKGSKFQGIRLDVNFRLPLNKLLQYKDLINMIN